MKMVLILVVAVATAAAGCGDHRGKQPGGSAVRGPVAGEMRITEARVPGSPVPIEGEISYVRVRRAGGATIANTVLSYAGDPLRLRVGSGRYTVSIWHRTCDGNCGVLDPASDRCETVVAVRSNTKVLVEIQNSPGSPCRIVTRAVAVRSSAAAPARIGLVYSKAVDFRDASGWIWFARTDGTQRVRLTRGSAPALSPDGRTVAFTRYWQPRHTAELWVVRSAGGRPRLVRRVTGKYALFIGQLVWGPDSRSLASVEARSIVLVDTVTGNARAFGDDGPRGSLTGVDWPSFSPDGGAIVYERYDQRGGDLFLYDTVAGRSRRLTADDKSFDPLWGPKTIAFNRGGFIRGGDIWLLNPDGGPFDRLTRTRAGIYPAAWSADGSRLLAANPATHNGRLWAVDVPSGRARDLTGWVGDLFPQGLSHDGSTILAAVGCGGLASPLGVVETLPFGGGKPRVIVEGPCRATWNR